MKFWNWLLLINPNCNFFFCCFNRDTSYANINVTTDIFKAQPQHKILEILTSVLRHIACTKCTTVVNVESPIRR